MSASVDFKKIQENLTVEANLQEAISTQFNLLISKLVDQLNFKRNLYHCVGCYDLVQWVLYCFFPIYESNPKLFETILYHIAYVSIVDDALDEDYSQESIDQMTVHYNILRDYNFSDFESNPATDFAKLISLDFNSDLFSNIKQREIEFFQVGIDLLKRGQDDTKMITSKSLNQFLADRRVDSMAKLFIEFYLSANMLADPQNDAFTKHSNIGCDIISLINDVTSLPKDIKNRVSNNWLILDHCRRCRISPYQLKLKLKENEINISDFDASLSRAHIIISKMLNKMKTIETGNPEYKEQFKAVSAIVKGYSTWCFSSERFKDEKHCLESLRAEQEFPVELLKPTSKSKTKYFDDIKNNNSTVLSN